MTKNRVAMPPPEIDVFTLRQIALGPDEIRGQVGSWAFVYTKNTDPEGNRWFVQPGYVGHEQMTNTHGMLQAFFGPKAGVVAGQVVSIGEVYAKDGQGQYASTGAKKEIWDWRTIRLLAKRENLFGRSGTLAGHRVVMLWGDPPGWEAMLIEVLRLLGIGREDEVLVIVGNAHQFVAGDFMV
jgi:hypothetical protein